MSDALKKGRQVSGYSLLEILIVLAIIALIVSLVGPRLFAQLDKSKVTAARVQMKSLKSALLTMKLDLGRFPTEQEGLGLLSTPPSQPESGWAGPYLDGQVPKDPWGRDYTYVPAQGQDESPKITTLGADGKPGGDGTNADLTL